MLRTHLHREKTAVIRWTFTNQIIAEEDTAQDRLTDGYAVEMINALDLGEAGTSTII